jgi:hypothetical protein
VASSPATASPMNARLSFMAKVFMASSFGNTVPPWCLGRRNPVFFSRL